MGCWSSQALSQGTHNLVGQKHIDKCKPWDIRKETFNAEIFRANFLEEVAL